MVRSHECGWMRLSFVGAQGGVRGECSVRQTFLSAERTVVN